MVVEDGGQHQTLVQQGVDPLLVRLNADHTVSGQRTRGYILISWEWVHKRCIHDAPSERRRML